MLNVRWTRAVVVLTASEIGPVCSDRFCDSAVPSVTWAVRRAAMPALVTRIAP
jgi:hypothetical protein